jgi:hypothetical protein
LAAHRDRYIQVVEGRRTALDALLRRLAEDPRHRDIRIIARGPAKHRFFSEWTMASPRISPKTTAALDMMMDAPDLSERQILDLLVDAVTQDR